MKFPAVLLAGSLAANAVLLGTFWLRPACAPPVIRGLFQRPSSTTAVPSPVPGSKERSDATAASLASRWATLPTDDLPRLITALKANGFPPRAIRAVVETLVESRYLPRLLDFRDVDPATPYWKSAPLLLDQRMGEYMRLSEEYSKARRDLLSGLSSRDDSDVTSVERWSYGRLTAGKIDAIKQIEQDYTEMTWQLRVATKGITLPEDQEKSDLLDQAKQADLAAMLSPEELEGYNLRKSKITAQLRPTLTAFQASEAEFRAIYGIEDSMSDALFPSIPTFEAIHQREAAEQQAADQIKAALGDARYVEFMRSRDVEYRRLIQLEQQEKLPAGTALQAFAFRAEVASESNRIFDDASLSNDQKRAALQTLAQGARAQFLTTLGATAGEAYLTGLAWLGNLEQGEAVTFVPSLTSNTSAHYRLVPPVALPGDTSAPAAK